MTERLKPCPFCGGSNLHAGDFDGILEDGVTVYIRCMNCGGNIEGTGAHPEEAIRARAALEDATERWNARKEADAILGALADMFHYGMEVYEDCGGDDENRGRAPRMRGEIKNAEAILKKWGWFDVQKS